MLKKKSHIVTIKKCRKLVKKYYSCQLIFPTTGRHQVSKMVKTRQV